MRVFFFFLLIASSLLGQPRLIPSDNPLQATSYFEIVFDESMVSQEEVGKEVENQLVSIVPEMEVQLTWRARNIARLLPKKAPILGASYQITLNEGLSTEQGLNVQGQVFKEVNVAPLEVISKVKQGTIRSGGLVLVFNDEVGASEVGPFFHFVRPKTEDQEQQIVAARTRQATWGDLGAQRYAYRQAWGDAFEKNNIDQQRPLTDVLSNAILVEPARFLPIGKGWTLKRLPGLSNRAEKATMENEGQYLLGDVDPFELRSAKAQTVVDGKRSIRLFFNQGISPSLSPEEIVQSLELKPRVTGLKATFESRRKTLVLHGDFEAEDYYEITIPKNFSGVDGLILEKAKIQKLKFIRATPQVILPSYDEAQLASGTRQYEIESVNQQELQITIKRMEHQDLIRAIQGFRSYTGRTANGKWLRNTGPIPFVLVGGEVVFDERVEIQAPLDTTTKHTIQWDQLLPPDRRSGSFFITVTGTAVAHPDLRQNRLTEAQSIVQLTDLGLAWKVTEDSAFVYAYSCQSGLPLKGVDLSSFGENATLIERVVTDQSGVARLKRGSEQRHLQASLNDDSFVIPFDRSLPEVSMWRFPIQFSWSGTSGVFRDVYLFTDRNLYQPGELVRLKGIARQKEEDEFKIPEQEPPTLKVKDPLGREVYAGELSLSEFGSFDFSYQLPKVTVGQYRFELTWPKDLERADEIDRWNEKRQIQQSSSFSHFFHVQEFKRNTFDGEATLVESADHELKYDLSARYYQGTPVAKARAKWYLYARPSGIYPTKFREFYFGNHREYDPYYWAHYFGYRDDDGHRQEGNHFQNGEIELSSEGRASLELTLPPIDDPMPRQVQLTAEVTDSNSQTLSLSRSIRVHSSDYYLGLSRDDRLARVGDEMPLRIVSVGQTGELYDKKIQATLTVSREEHTQIKSRAANGAMVIQNEKSIIPIREVIFFVPSSSSGVDLPFVPQEAGRYIFELTSYDSRGRLVKTTTTRQVYGGSDYPWEYESGMRIKLVPEQQRYQPGDQARILVLSPIEGEALITVEKKGVLRHFCKQLTLKDPVIELPLSDLDAPNVFVSVLVIKGTHDSKRKRPEPQLRLGYCELEVAPRLQRLHVEMAPLLSEVRPGENVQVRGRILSAEAKPVAQAEVVFYAEDEGVLKVMGYENPDPLAYFHAPRPLEMRNGTSLGNFISESSEDRNLANKGFIIGDGGDGGWSGEESLTARENFDPCAAWMPKIKTDLNGEFVVNFISPDTLTRYRLIAVVHDGQSRFGTGAGEVVVNKPLMLEPAPPLFAHQGDQIRAKALLQNQSDHGATWKVSLELGGLSRPIRTEGEGKDQTLTKLVKLEAHSQESVEFDVHFIETGKAQWVWSAVALDQEDPVLRKSLSDAVKSEFQVHYPMPLLRETHFLSIQGAQPEQDLLEPFSEELINGVGQVEFEFARSRLIEASGAIDYLLHYPYGCVEQTTSSTMPWVAAKKLRHLVPGFQNKSESEIEKAIQSGVDRLLSMQTRNGGLAYWPGRQDALPWASSYGAMGLILCRDAGAQVPEKALKDLGAYLSTQLRNLSAAKSSADLELIARSLYVLAALGQAEPAYHAKLLERLDELSLASRSFLAMALHLSGQKGAQELLRQKPMAGKGSGYWMNHRSEEAMTLLAWATIEPTSDSCEQALDRLIATRSSQGHWQTTWCNAWALLAMGTYAQSMEKELQKITITLRSSDGVEELTLPVDRGSCKVSFPLKAGFFAKAFADQKVYLYGKLAAKPRISPIEPVSKSGVTVNRIYQRVSASGQSEDLDEPRIGDLVKVSLEVFLPNESFRYLVIDDPLPSCFQAINSDFGSQSRQLTDKKNWQISHQEIRRDRVLFFADDPQTNGKLSFSYHARVTHAGSIYVPPTKVEEMYRPESFALGSSNHLEVK